MQDKSICLCCLQEETAPIWKPVIIPAPDFDLCGQEFDPICTDNYDIAGFELYCSNCKEEFSKLRQAEQTSDELPF
jgi:hypothetical protein